LTRIQSQFWEKQSQFWAKIGFVLGLFGFVFWAAKSVENVISSFIISTCVHLSVFKIGFVLHNKVFIARAVLKVNW